MITTLLGGISASPFRRAALRYGAIALTIVLFLLSIRRAGERMGRLAERLETTEKANEIQHRMLEAAARLPRDRGELVDRLRDGGF
jgi:DNA integrity scanning protein DisA with diadenylate cyclase activity